MNLFEKLLNITNEIAKVNKNLIVGEGQSSYKAVGEADVLKAVKELEFKYKVYSYPCSRQIVDRDILQTEKDYKGTVTKSTKQFMRIETVYRFVDIEKPEEYIEMTTYGDGLDSGDKAPGKAMTYSDKYALLKAYKMITGDDPDQNPSDDENWKSAKVTDLEAKTIYSLIMNTGTDLNRFLEHYKIKNTNELNKEQYAEALKTLEGKKNASNR